MEWMVCSVSFNKIGWMPSGNSHPRCCKDCHRFFNHPWCSMLRSVIRYDWTKCIRPENVQQNQIMFMLFCQSHLTSPNQDKFRKRSYFLKFRSSTQLFLCRRNIMKHLCSSWLMDWALPFLPEPLPHALSISRSSQSTMTSVTWKRPPCDWCLTFTSMLHPPPPPGYTLPRRSNHANLMAGWRRVEVPPAAPPPLLVYHERIVLWHHLVQHTKGLFLFVLTYQFVASRGDLAVFYILQRFCSPYLPLSVYPKG